MSHTATTLRHVVFNTSAHCCVIPINTKITCAPKGAVLQAGVHKLDSAEIVPLEVTVRVHGMYMACVKDEGGGCLNSCEAVCEK